MPLGKVIQVKYAQSGPARQTISSATPVVITGLSIDFTPLSSNSIIIVEASVSTCANYVTNYSVYKDGSATASIGGETNLSNTTANRTVYIGAVQDGWMWTIPLQWSETNNSTTLRTYDIRNCSFWNGTTRTTFINNRDNNDMASFSSMLVTEYDIS